MDPFVLCLKESDDYELIFTCPPDKIDQIKEAISRIDPVPVTEIGQITEQEDLMQRIHPDGTGSPIEPTGWDHFDNQGEYDDN